MPPALSWEEAASIPLTFLVSYDMLVLQGRLKAGEWLLINGVSSGVGVASLQLAKALGAKVIGTSGSARQARGAQAPRPRRRAVHARSRLRAGGDGGDRAAWRRPHRQYRRRLRVRRKHPRAGLRRPARHGGICRWRAARRHRPRRPARQAAHAVRRLQQAAHQGAARRPPCRGSSRRCCRISPPDASSRRSTRSSTSRSWSKPRNAWNPAGHVGKIVLRMPEI